MHADIQSSLPLVSRAFSHLLQQSVAITSTDPFCDVRGKCHHHKTKWTFLFYRTTPTNRRQRPSSRSFSVNEKEKIELTEGRRRRERADSRWTSLERTFVDGESRWKSFEASTAVTLNRSIGTDLFINKLMLFFIYLKTWAPSFRIFNVHLGCMYFLGTLIWIFTFLHSMCS